MIQTLLIIIVIGLLVSRFLPVKGVKQIDAADMKPQLRRQHQQLIDVRSPVEFQTDHIKGFRNIPLPQLRTSKSACERQRGLCDMPKRNEKYAGSENIEEARIYTNYEYQGWHECLALSMYKIYPHPYIKEDITCSNQLLF